MSLVWRGGVCRPAGLFGEMYFTSFSRRFRNDPSHASFQVIVASERGEVVQAIPRLLGHLYRGPLYLTLGQTSLHRLHRRALDDFYASRNSNSALDFHPSAPRR